MIRDLLVTTAVIIAGLVAYRYQHVVLDALRRFDARNVKRIADQEQERNDPVAHFKHTLATAEEQVETVSEITVSDPRTATPVTRYVFEGEQFATRADAERVRAEKIRAIARGYYMDLPIALSERRKDKLH
ncbi:MAG TPA: hypothetical protein VGU69_05765 [Rhizomicrobium sp.]|nr:hypothetical protein [Rhizomicrobium sp.]